MDDNRYRISILVLGGVVISSMLPVVIAAVQGTEPPPAIIGLAATALGGLLALITGPRQPLGK